MTIIKSNQNFPPESAGQLMTFKIPVVESTATIADIERILFEKTKEIETINYVYIIDKSKKLQGVISIKELFLRPKSIRVSQVMIKNLVKIQPYVDQEEVALLALQHNLKAIPVVDQQGLLLGAVSSDAILKILHNENIEDVLRFVGIGKIKDPAISIIKASASFHFRKRIPWLILGLLGGVVAAFVVDFFEEALRAQIILAAFIPVVVYMADAVGTQTETLFIRSLSLDRRLNLKKYFGREIKINLFLALILGLMLAIISWWWQQSAFLSLVLLFSIFIAVLVSVVIAMFIPWILFKTKHDPAIASGPFATVLSDMLSLLIYFSIAQIMLSLFLNV